jgi:FkbM family methyltransferase
VSFTHDHDLEALRLIEPRDVPFKMYVTPRFEWHYLSNSYEPYTARLLAKMCERASLFFDIGAHYGFFSLNVASHQPELKIIAVEPAKSNFDILNRNVSFNRFKNVQTYNVAISDGEGEKPFHIYEASDNCGLHLHPQSRLLRTESVRTTTVDAILSSARVGPIVIKIDTEGHEFALLAGMKQTLHRFPDLAMFVEFNPKMLKAAGHDPTEFLRRIDELGLTTFLLDDDKQRHFRIGPGVNWSDFVKPEGYANLVCLPKRGALNVLFVSHSSSMGGAERSLLELIDELIADHWTLATVVCPGDGPLPDALRNVGASVLTSSYRWWCALEETSETQARITEDLRSVMRLLPLLRALDADVVWTQTMVIPWGAVIALLLGKRHVWSICEYGERDHHFRFFVPFRKVLQFLERSSDFVFAGSPSLLRELLPGLGSDKSDFLFRHIPIPNRGHSEQFWRRKDAKRIAVLGTIEEGKGQEDLVRAVAVLKKRKHKVELLIAGQASGDGYLARLCALIDKLEISDIVVLPGVVQAPYEVLASADIVASCSRAEAFGRTVIEAMLLSRPVIYSRAGSHLDYMIDQVTGLSYSPGNVEELVDRIETLIGSSDLGRSLGDSAKAYATEKFTRADYGGKVHKRLLNFRDGRDRRTTVKLDAYHLLYAGLDLLIAPDPVVPPIDELHRLNSELLERDREIVRAGNELRRLVTKVDERDQQLITANVELRRIVARADSDLRRAIGEIEDRDKQIAAADREVRRLISEVDDRDQRLATVGDELRRVVVQADSDLRRAIGEIEDRDKQIAAADREMRRLIADVDARDQQLATACEELRGVIGHTDGDLRRAIGKIQERDQHLIAAGFEVRRLAAEVDDRDQRLVATNEELLRVITQADSDLPQANSAADERDREIDERDQRLATTGRRLHEIESSTIWCITAPLRRLSSGWRRTFSRQNE